MYRLWFLILFVLALGFSGCSFTTMKTARQLEANEVVVSGSLDLPGFVYVPRANFQATYGLADVGDISVHAGTTLLTMNGGLGARAYVTDRFNLSVEADAILGLIQLPFTDTQEYGVPTITSRFLTSVLPGELFYGGLQSTFVFALVETVPHPEVDFGAVVMGGVLGLDMPLNKHIGMQAEISILPIYYNYESGLKAFYLESTGDDFPIPFMGQIGLSFYYRSLPFVEYRAQAPDSAP